MKPKRFKNILFSCDDKGGVGKSTAATSVADAALFCGYSVRLIDGDIENRTLFKCFPDKAVCLPDLDDFTFQNTLVELSEMTEDLAIVDLPGQASSVFRDYFADNSPEAFHEMGLRIIIATTVCETIGALEGTKKWIEAFGDLFEFLVLINEKDTRKGQKFDLASYPIGSVILDFCDGHLIRIPCLPPILKGLYDRNYGAPSDFCPKGRLVNELKLPPTCSGQWSKHRNRIIESFLCEAEWLTGRPVPQPTEKIVAPSIHDDPVRQKRLAGLYNTLPTGPKTSEG